MELDPDALAQPERYKRLLFCHANAPHLPGPIVRNVAISTASGARQVFLPLPLAIKALVTRMIRICVVGIDVGDAACNDEDRCKQQQRPDGHEQHGQTGIASGDKDPAEKESRWEQDGGGDHAARRQRSRYLVEFGHSSQRQAERDVDERQQRSVGMRQRPQQSARLVRDIQVEVCFEAMEHFKRSAQYEEHEQCVPSEAKMSLRQRCGAFTGGSPIGTLRERVMACSRSAPVVAGAVVTCLP